MQNDRKKVLVLCPYPTGSAPSQRFRFEQYLQFLDAQGFDLDIKPFIDQQTWDLLYKPGLFFQKTLGMLRSTIRRFSLLFSLRKYAFVFMHREAMQFGPPVLEYIISKVLKKKVLYDFDDAIWLKNHSDSNAILSFTKWYKKVHSISAWVTTIQCGNQYLADFSLQYNKNVTIIPTTIDTLNLHNQTIDYTKERIALGWTGSHSTMHYLNRLVPILEKLESKFDFDFVVISDRNPEFSLKSLVYCPWKKETELEDLLKIDIGVMPLTDNPWSEGKCAFKGLQYMALGIPTVMSPVGMNKTLIQHNVNGLLVDSDKEWEDAFILLLSSVEERIRIGKAGQNTVTNEYSVEANKNKYLNLFRQLSQD